MQPGLILYLGVVRRGECESPLGHGLPSEVLVDTNTPLRLADASRFALVESFDFSRPRSELVQRGREIRDRYDLCCLVNMVEHYVNHTADVAEALGLSGLSPAIARLCVDMKAMRQRFLECIRPRATARFQAVASETELLGFGDVAGYPVFLQPDNPFSSLWSTYDNTAEELVTSYSAMRNGVLHYNAAIAPWDKRLTALAAEYIVGRNRSIDCLIDAEGHVSTTPVVDALTGTDNGIDDFHSFGLVTPSGLGIDGQEELEGLAVAEVKALGMAACAAHVEFIGNRLGEIGAPTGRESSPDPEDGLWHRRHPRLLPGLERRQAGPASGRRRSSSHSRGTATPCARSVISRTSSGSPPITITRFGSDPPSASVWPGTATAPHCTSG